MANLKNVVQVLKKEHARLTKQIEGISAALAAFSGTYTKRTGARKISAAGRARIAAAQTARWAKLKGKSKGATPKKRVMSASARKKIAAAQQARWARAKAAK
jgi:hypothetical protein